MEGNHATDRQPVYQITLRGTLDESWSGWLSGMRITSSEMMTTITGAIADQSALRGILCRLWDLNLDVISVIRVADAASEKLSEKLMDYQDTKAPRG